VNILEALCLVTPYGPFSLMTVRRPKIIIGGSTDTHAIGATTYPSTNLDHWFAAAMECSASATTRLPDVVCSA
jgi:hypothetical protein